MNLIQGEYNFTASITSDIGNLIEIVNITSKAIVINQSNQIVNLICDVSSNFFEIVDIDGVPVDSGWIIVGNSTHELQNCSIDSNGHARFWWVDTLPYQYNISPYVIKKGSLPSKPAINIYKLKIISSVSVEGKPTTAGTANEISIKKMFIILRLIKIFFFCISFSAIPDQSSIIFKEMTTIVSININNSVKISGGNGKNTKVIDIFITFLIVICG